MINIFLDMDGVVCDFTKATYSKMPKFDSKIFSDLVFNDKIFEDLEWQENGQDFYNYLLTLQTPNINIEILSSLGSPGDILRQQVIANQKTTWLLKNDINIHRNFTVHKGKKKLFATPNSILIDDTAQNIYDFQEMGGFALYYDHTKPNDNKTIIKLLIQQALARQKAGIYGGLN